MTEPSPKVGPALVRTRVLDIVAVILLTAFALWLRIWGNCFGLPSLFGADEGRPMDAALSPSLVADRFYYGPIVGYLIKAVLALYWLIGAMEGRFHTWADLQAEVDKDPTTVYVIARSACGMLGALTVLLVALYGRRWYGRMVGYGAALLLAVNTTHARESHYVGTDVPMTFFVTIAFGYAAAAWERPDRRRLNAVAVLLGCAMAVKYNAIFALTMPLLIHWRHRPAQGWRAFLKNRGLWRSLAIAIAIPLVLSWSALFRPANFVHDVGTILLKPISGHLGAEVGVLSWVFAARGSLGAELGWLGLGVIPFVIWRAVRRRHGSDVVALALLLPVLCITGLSSVKIMRYIAPALPPLCLLTAAWLADAVQRTGRWSCVSFAAGLAALAAWPLWATVQRNCEMTKPDTRNIAAVWASAHLPPGSQVLAYGGAGPYNPPLDEKRFDSLGLPSLSIRLLLKDRPPKELHLRDYPCADYAILSSYACDRFYQAATQARYPRIASAYRRCFAEIRAHRKVAQFAPVRGRTQGPVLEIYALRDAVHR
jgi:hypothetical protein